VKVPILKNQVQMNMSLHLHFINNGKRTFIWLRLKQIGKDNKKAKIDLSSPIDKSDQQDSTIFLSGNHKIGYFTIDATFMPVTRVNYLIQVTIYNWQKITLF
jgi:hypothetical protein